MNINNIKPLYDKIIVKKLIYESKKNGIILNNSNTKNFYKGIVIATGEGKLLENGKIIPLKVQKNDKIIFEENYNTKIEIINNEELYFITENDIFAIWN